MIGIIICRTRKHRRLLKKELTLEELKSYIPDPKNNNDEKKRVSNAKLEDKKHTFNATKVRHTVACDNCGAPRVVYSNHAVGQKMDQQRISWKKQN